MPDAPAAIRATFSDFKTVKSRKILQLLFEIPIEEGSRALEALGGIPHPGTEVWCGIARLDTKKIEKPKRSFEELPLTQQIGIICNEPAFWRFLRSRGEDVENAQHAAEFVRNFCEVKSRQEIVPHSLALEHWNEVANDYEAWKAHVP